MEVSSSFISCGVHLPSFHCIERSILSSNSVPQKVLQCEAPIAGARPTNKAGCRWSGQRSLNSLSSTCLAALGIGQNQKWVGLSSNPQRSHLVETALSMSKSKLLAQAAPVAWCLMILLCSSLTPLQASCMTCMSTSETRPKVFLRVVAERVLALMAMASR